MHLRGAVYAIRHIVEETGNGDEHGQKMPGEQCRRRQSFLIGKPDQSNSKSNQDAMQCRQDESIKLNEGCAPGQAEQDGYYARTN